MPTVNTLVVDRADLLGLGQLHQLRGRVGRAGQRAYAYLFHPVDRVLSEQAYERLRTIGDHTELGSGFKIALRDLQIRGAGNLLGRDQSGPHRRHRLRPLRPDGVRGGVRAEGRAPAPAGRPLPRPARRRPPAGHLRGGRGRPAGGLPPAHRRAHRGADRRRAHRVGGPVRPAARPGRGPARRGPAAGRVPAPGDHRPRRHRSPHRDGAEPRASGPPSSCPRSPCRPRPRCGCAGWPPGPPTRPTSTGC